MQLVCEASLCHKALSMQRKQEKLVDMQVRTADGVIFKLHRCVLASSSDFMNVLFQSGMRDSETTVALETITSSLFSAFVDFIYDGQCEVDESQLPALLEAASLLQSLPLQEKTTYAIVSRMGPHDALPVWSLGDKLMMPDLVEAATLCAAANFESFAQSDAILDATYEQLTNILQHTSLKVKNYDIMFEAIVRWEAAVRPAALVGPLFCMCKELSEAHLCVRVSVVTLDHLRQQIGTTRFLDLADFSTDCTSILIKKEHTLLQLKQKIWRLTGVLPTEQRLWKWARRQNQTFRPDCLLQEADDHYGEEACDDHVAMMAIMASSRHSSIYDIFSRSAWPATLRLYLEPVSTRSPQTAFEPPPAHTVAPNDEGYPPLMPGELLLFFKFYEPACEQLSFVGTHVAANHHTLEDLLPVLRASNGLAADAELTVYEEVHGGCTEFEIFELRDSFEPIQAGKCLKDCELQSGDIIVFQLAQPVMATVNSAASAGGPRDDVPPPSTVLELLNSEFGQRAPLLTIPQFFQHVKGLVVVHLHDWWNPPYSVKKCLKIAMDMQWSYEKVPATLQYRYIVAIAALCHFSLTCALASALLSARR